MSSGVTLEPIVAYLDDLLQVSQYDEGEPSKGCYYVACGART